MATSYAKAGTVAQLLYMEVEPSGELQIHQSQLELGSWQQPVVQQNSKHSSHLRLWQTCLKLRVNSLRALTLCSPL